VSSVYRVSAGNRLDLEVAVTSDTLSLLQAVNVALESGVLPGEGSQGLPVGKMSRTLVSRRLFHLDVFHERHGTTPEKSCGVVSGCQIHGVTHLPFNIPTLEGR
jgi:hypothetical protein